MSTGPIRIKRGDTAEIIVAGMCALGSTNQSSLSILQLTDDYAQYFFDASIAGSVTSAKNRNASPGSFALYQNYPNPFNPSTTISYVLPSFGRVTLKVFDVLGREVTTLVDRNGSPGIHSVIFDASKMTSGVYFYRLQAGSSVETGKLLLLK